jgi:D-serine deaminase-like pyridoxal phosphate-dependent protein
MNRTGIAPGKDAAMLFKLITDQPVLKAEGLHVYDGHIHEHDFSEREKVCNEAFKSVAELVDELRKINTRPLSIVAGGTPTFPIHATRKGVETSPGTVLLWDYGYSSSFTDLNFLHSAVLLTRIVSKPGKDLICIDLGHKAIGSEMPQPRVKFLDLDNYTIIGHNEEHMVIRTERAGNLKTGDVLGIPYHIRPTVDRYDVVTVVRNGTLRMNGR